MAKATKKPQGILFVGPPGVGKGTQAELLANDKEHYVHFSTGEMFRTLDPNSEDGKIVHSIIDTGHLVPDEITVDLFEHKVTAMIKDGTFDPEKHLLILDGIPRNPHQAEMLHDFIDVIQIIYLTAKDNVLTERLAERAKKENRPDDQDESIFKRRIRIYKEKTEKLIHSYDDRILTTIDGEPSVEDIQKEIKEKVKA